MIFSFTSKFLIVLHLDKLSFKSYAKMMKKKLWQAQFSINFTRKTIKIYSPCRQKSKKMKKTRKPRKIYFSCFSLLYDKNKKKMFFFFFAKTYFCLIDFSISTPPCHSSHSSLSSFLSLLFVCCANVTWINKTSLTAIRVPSSAEQSVSKWVINRKES